MNYNNNSNHSDMLNQAYIDPNDLQFSYSSENWLDIDNCILENTQNDLDSTLFSTNSLPRCDPCLAEPGAHFLIPDDSDQICEPATFNSSLHAINNTTDLSKSSIQHFGNDASSLLQDSCLLFITQTSEEIAESQKVPRDQFTFVTNLSRKDPTPDNMNFTATKLNRPVSCCSNAKKLISKFAKRLRMSTKPHKEIRAEKKTNQNLPVNTSAPTRLSKSSRKSCVSNDLNVFNSQAYENILLQNRVVFLPTRQGALQSNYDYDYDFTLHFKPECCEFNTLGNFFTYLV